MLTHGCMGESGGRWDKVFDWVCGRLRGECGSRLEVGGLSWWNFRW